MRQYPFFTSVILISGLFLAACSPPISISTLSPARTEAPFATPALTENSSIGGEVSPEPPVSSLVVAFVKDGDIYLWEESTHQSRVLIRAGDVINVKISDDGQRIAFLRHSLVEQPELVEFTALWVVDRDGKNPRELISADSIRQRLNPPAADSAGFAQIEWIPGTHRLVYNGIEFLAPGQGFTISKDIYLVDADTGADTVLASNVMPDTFLNAWRFVISPDGQQIALFSVTELSFINVDGSNWRPAILTYPYPPVMGDGVLLPRGVWTQDSQAFVFTGPMPSEPRAGFNYTIWRVPTDGSPSQSLATLTDSHSSYISFSPDGGRMAFFQDINGDEVIQIEDQQIMPLAAAAGPLTLPPRDEQSDVRWSPDGQAFVIKDQNLFRLCPEAANAAQVCGDPIPLAGGTDLIDGFEWVDEDSFLYRALEPTTLYLGRLDGTITPIVTLTEEESWGGWSFQVPN